MKVFIATVTSAALTFSLSACTPKKTEPERPEVTFAVVEVCADTVHLIRYVDLKCENLEDGYGWRYIANRAGRELPAVGEKIALTSSGAMPTGQVIGRIPPEGARFKK